MLDKYLRNKLDERLEKGTMRSLSSFDGMIDLVSNDFLGLSRMDDPSIGKPASGGSRLISGNTKRIEEIERELADFFRSDSALFFNSGYQTNIALFSSIPDKHALVLYDKEIHASVRDGLKMSSARSLGFIHNDVKDLERLLSKYREDDQEQLIFVAIEALYSMSGELAPIERMVEICEHYKAILIVDEAHSCGVYGEEGRGYADQLGMADRIPIRLVTFGKAYGAHGAMVIGSKDLRTFLINYARSLIYTTAISERTVERIYRNVIDPDNRDRRVRLKENIARFRRVFSSETLISDEQSPIQILRGTRNELQLLNDRLKKANIAAKVILPPTVPEGKECIRIVIHAFNSDSELDLLIETLKQQK